MSNPINLYLHKEELYGLIRILNYVIKNCEDEVILNYAEALRKIHAYRIGLIHDTDILEGFENNYLPAIGVM